MCRKSKFFENFTKIKIFGKFSIYRKFDENLKIFIKSKFFENLTQSKNFQNSTEIYFFLYFVKNRNFSQILTKIKIFQKFD